MISGRFLHISKAFDKSKKIFKKFTKKVKNFSLDGNFQHSYKVTATFWK